MKKQLLAILLIFVCFGTSVLKANSDSDISGSRELTIDDLLRKLRQNQNIADEEIDRMAALLLEMELTLSPENILPKLYLLRGSNEPITPTAKKPLKKEQSLEWLILTLENQRIMNLLPEETTAHPSAKVFPGPVATDAKRVIRDITFNTNLPGWHNHGFYSESTKAYWHSTGLYAAPGEL
ncbi:MAG: hypothetical protein FVQ79_14130, partial [Planctomycetes bacterium]|nr:hypothetical protein [Planctomycetota bacterium]